MTEAEARAKVKEFPTEPDWFCPLIKDSCRSECWCYFGPYVSSTYPNSKKWVAKKAGCDNAMFSETTIQY